MPIKQKPRIVVDEVPELLFQFGFHKTKDEGRFRKVGYTVELQDQSILITKHKPRNGDFMWNETYFNSFNLKKYLEKNHKNVW